MSKGSKLTIYQKIILAVLLVMVLVFSVLYWVTLHREGFRYLDMILVPSEEDGKTVYSGRHHGVVPTSFSVAADGTVVFQYGEETFGPYTLQEDPSAIPEKMPMEYSGKDIRGLELRCGEQVIFRGCEILFGSNRLLFTSNGSSVSSISLTMEDEVEPSVYELIDLMSGPKLTHKGDVFGWFSGLLLCAVTAFSILFADELFRWHLRFRIADPENAEPSDWEIASRYIAWTVFPVLALFVFVMGLR
ncbi:MAG: hypothetical protein J6A42_00795 [Firmicutes bacterium]|nr:hypothetical protein [Bacillota bacterium]